MALAVLLIGLLFAAEGILGLAAPELFAGLAVAVQTPPMLYLAGAICVLLGVVLIRAAPTSRIPNSLRSIGFIIVIIGLLTPFFGAQLAHGVVGLSSGPVMRAWAGTMLVIGTFIVYAAAPNRPVD